MDLERDYVFKSERLGFRNWLKSDLPKMAKISADPEVMEFFPATKSIKETEEFIARMQKEFNKRGYCYFAVDHLIDKEFIGFIGISNQDFDAEFTPCIDIGWRLSKSHWDKGYATEGAKRCLEFAFKKRKIIDIKAIAPVINLKSEHVMKKIGMTKILTFNHSLLKHHKKLITCTLYEIKNVNFAH